MPKGASADKPARAQLSQQRACIAHSVVTLDCMLSREGDFDGGLFQTLECDGQLKTHAFAHGDVVVFPSYKYHSITPVTRGCRRVLVVELWHGDEKHCNHRCDTAQGSCAEEGSRAADAADA
eukprot:3610723-Prymnesium_polylepis.2